MAVWTVRNWVSLEVFQPLAPRYLNDPGDRVNFGVYRWMRTWSVEYVSTATVFWRVGLGPIDPGDLPARAFDSPSQREQTLALLDAYNRTNSDSGELDSRFAALAAERIHANPFRYYAWLPLLRTADMILRPRTEEFNLEVFWWRWSDHPAETCRGDPGWSRQSLLCRSRGVGFSPPPRAVAVDARWLRCPALFTPGHDGELRAALLAGVFSHLYRGRRGGDEQLKIRPVANDARRSR